MLLGIKDNKTTFLRHLFVGTIGLTLVYLMYLSYGAWGVEPTLWPDWGADHPYWRAWAHAAFVLLFITLVIGPVARLWHPFTRLLSWRRELGVWFAILSAGHAYAIWDRWARWDFGSLFGFQYIDDFGAYVLTRPEVGIMNMMMLMAAPMIVLLAITSFDKAVSFLGISSWKWLHNSLIHAIFYILILRGTLYFFFFFQASPPEWRVYPDIWFLYAFLGMALLVVSLQAAAFAKTVLQHRSYGQKDSAFQIAAVIGIALLFVSPMVITLGTVWYFDSRVIKENPMPTGQIQPGQSYTPTFHMTIHEPGQEIYLWASNLDSNPYFRQTIEVSGIPVSHQIYRNSDQTLYHAELQEDGELNWSEIENVGPEDIGLSEISGGPGVWAEQYGVGEHQIQLSQGILIPITIHSTNEAIAEEIFVINSTPIK